MTVKNRYPLPLIRELIDKLKGAKYFMALDIRWGYNNVQMKEGDKKKVAFLTNRGLYEPLVMFFRLCNLPSTFQTMMNHLFILRAAIHQRLSDSVSSAVSAQYNSMKSTLQWTRPL